MATFTATPAFLGNVNFLIIDIDIRQVAAGLQAYLIRGSQLTGVSLDDIDLGLHTLPTDPRNATLADLLAKGMKLFDAIVWLTAGRPTSHPLMRDPTKTEANTPSMHEVARAVFYVYFFLVTQARYPTKVKDEKPPAVAKFLKEVMGMKADPEYYVGVICSFEPKKFNPAWVRFVNFENLGQEVLSRFGLGVAGYRMFGPFKLYLPKEGLSAEIMNAYTFAKTIAMSPPSWDVHPLTRNPSILTARGNLNKNLGNLILECFTGEQIAEMVKARVLFESPTREPNHMNYKSWAPIDNISGNAPIFQVN